MSRRKQKNPQKIQRVNTETEDNNLYNDFTVTEQEESIFRVPNDDNGVNSKQTGKDQCHNPNSPFPDCKKDEHDEELQSLIPTDKHFRKNGNVSPVLCASITEDKHRNNPQILSPGSDKLIKESSEYSQLFTSKASKMETSPASSYAKYPSYYSDNVYSRSPHRITPEYGAAGYPYSDNQSIAYYPYMNSNYTQSNGLPGYQVWPPVSSSMGYLSYYPPYLTSYTGKDASPTTLTSDRPSVIVKAPPATKTSELGDNQDSIDDGTTSSSSYTSHPIGVQGSSSPPLPSSPPLLPSSSSSSSPPTKPKNHVCNICGKAFAKSSTLTSHIRIHTGEKPFGCELCCAKFSRLSTLKYHMMVHKGETKYKCDVCSKQFRHLSHYKDHSRIHSGEKKHRCEVCGKQFGRIGHYKDHLRIHTGEKPFKCNVCSKAFSQRSGMKYHMVKEHDCSSSDDHKISSFYASGNQNMMADAVAMDIKDESAVSSPSMSVSSSSLDNSVSKDEESENEDEDLEDDDNSDNEESNDVINGKEDKTPQKKSNRKVDEHNSLLKQVLLEPMPKYNVNPISTNGGETTATRCKETSDRTISDSNVDSHSIYLSEEISKDFGEMNFPSPVNDAPMVHPVLQEYTTF